MLEVLASFMDEKIFDMLRTKEQLGYMVGCGKKKTCGIHGISFYIQSAEYSPVYL